MKEPSQSPYFLATRTNEGTLETIAFEMKNKNGGTETKEVFYNLHLE